MSYNLQRLLVDTNKIYTHAQKKSLPLKSSSFRFSAAQSEIFFSAIFNRDESHKIKAIKNRNKFVSNCKFETTVDFFQFKASLIFRGTYNYFNVELGIVLEDLHDENVLTRNNILYFIATVFFTSEDFWII